jgi:hypothetical protein
LAAVLRKAALLDRRAGADFNDRQRRVVDGTRDGFEGKLTA